jgi:hypothetical protein
MGFKIFGFEFGKNETDPNLVTPVALDSEAAITVDSMPYGGVQTFALDLEGIAQSENESIDKYREISNLPEVDRALEEIVGDAIIGDNERPPVTVRLDDLEIPDKIKDKITEEFTNVLGLLHFRTKGYDIFRRWYVDGRIHYHLVIDQSNPKAGIQELRYIDAKKIKKVRESIKRKGQTDLTSEEVLQKKFIEYYIYSDNSLDPKKSTAFGSATPSSIGSTNQDNTVKLAKDSVAYCSSGLVDHKNNIPISFLQKAIRPANNLRMMEDAIVIYRITRAPERRIFYIDVGNLQKGRAEQYMQQIMTKYKNKLVYDANTGEIKDNRRHLAMTEDFWIPRKEGSAGTQIDTLPSGGALGELGDVDYFKKKLWESLNIPMSRVADQPSMFNSGTDITRDELRFARFISRLRAKFSELLQDILGKQLVLKNVMPLEYWEAIKDSICFDFIEDNYFSEQMQTQLLTARMQTATMAQPFMGQFFSKEYVYKKILMMNDDEIKQMKKQMQKEIAAGELMDPVAMQQQQMQQMDPNQPPQDPSQQQPPQF